MPGNGLPLAVQVGCQIDGVDFLGGFFQILDDFFFARQDLVTRIPTLFRVDAHALEQFLPFLDFRVDRQRLAFGDGFLWLGLGTCFFGFGASGQITDMADAGFHDEILAEVFVDGLGLGRRLHNDQRFRHDDVGVPVT